jgi:hypothetical protein
MYFVCIKGANVCYSRLLQLPSHNAVLVGLRLPGRSVKFPKILKFHLLSEHSSMNILNGLKNLFLIVSHYVPSFSPPWNSYPFSVSGAQGEKSEDDSARSQGQQPGNEPGAAACTRPRPPDKSAEITAPPERQRGVQVRGCVMKTYLIVGSA